MRRNSISRWGNNETSFCCFIFHFLKKIKVHWRFAIYINTLFLHRAKKLHIFPWTIINLEGWSRKVWRLKPAGGRKRSRLDLRLGLPILVWNRFKPVDWSLQLWDFPHQSLNNQILSEFFKKTIPTTRANENLKSPCLNGYIIKQNDTKYILLEYPQIVNLRV